MKNKVLLSSAAFSTVVSLCLVTPVAGGKEGDQDATTYSNDEVGVSLKLPDKSWKLYDQSQGTIKILLFSPQSNFTTRCTVMLFPNTVIPDGLLTREKQLKAALGDAYQRVAYGDAKLAGRQAKRLEYSTKGTKSIEWAFADGDFVIIFQLSAARTGWENPEINTALNSIRDSLVYRGTALKKAVAEVDRSTPQQVRAKRKKLLGKPPRAYELTHHDLQVTISPPDRSLRVRDKLRVKFLQPDVKSMELYTSIVRVDSVTGPEALSWSSKPAGAGNNQTDKLTITFAQPLDEGAQVELTVRTSSDDYFQAIDQQLVAEVAVLGQVRENSTYSSHIVYYPIDPTNAATAHIELTVPDGYTAVTGGQLVSQRTDGDATTFIYDNKHRRKRLLPFGFAVAKYISQVGTSKSGLRLTVFGYAGEEELVRQRVSVAVEAANLFEQMMGALPWKDVRFAHVTPVRKETGISMPGLIVISDGFFKDISRTDLSNGILNNRDVLGLLVITDELSHQWNIYATPLPNELGEGISTFTNMLFIKNRHGEEAFRRGIKLCQDAYFQSTAVAKDVAIADPGVYQTTAYRGIVFCKTPVILTMLRDLIGTAQFFAAWRIAFNQFEAGKDGFEVIEKAFSETTRTDLSWFFDQWFFQAGWPQLTIEHKQQEKKLTVTITQTQESAPYRLYGLLRISGRSEHQTLQRMVQLTKAENKIEFDCPFPASNVVFDPDNKLLKEIVTRNN